MQWRNGQVGYQKLVFSLLSSFVQAGNHKVLIHIVYLRKAETFFDLQNKAWHWPQEKFLVAHLIFALVWNPILAGASEFFFVKWFFMFSFLNTGLEKIFFINFFLKIWKKEVFFVPYCCNALDFSDCSQIIQKLVSSTTKQHTNAKIKKKHVNRHKTKKYV